MKKLFIAVFAISILFTSCAKKTEQSSETQQGADSTATPGTHKHADGEVHEDHKPADTTATEDTHKHADGEVHQNHATKDSTIEAKPHKHPH